VLVAGFRAVQSHQSICRPLCLLILVAFAVQNANGFFLFPEPQRPILQEDVPGSEIFFELSFSRRDDGIAPAIMFARLCFNFAFFVKNSYSYFWNKQNAFASFYPVFFKNKSIFFNLTAAPASDGLWFCPNRFGKRFAHNIPFAFEGKYFNLTETFPTHFPLSKLIVRHRLAGVKQKIFMGISGRTEIGEIAVEAPVSMVRITLHGNSCDRRSKGNLKQLKGVFWAFFAKALPPKILEFGFFGKRRVYA